MPVPRVPTLFFSDEELRTDNSLGLRGFDSIERNRETRFVAVAGVFVQHAFADGAIDRRHRWLEKIPSSRGIAGGDGGAQALHQRAHTGAVGPVHFRALTSLRRAITTDFFFFFTLVACPWAIYRSSWAIFKLLTVNEAFCFVKRAKRRFS